MEYCDLHTHSVYSDGTDTPTEIIKKAEKLGLKAVALTDHNSINGLREFISASKTTSVEAVAGIEFSTDYKEKELHIVGLFIQEKYYKAVDELFTEFAKLKEASNKNLVLGLNKLGMNISYEHIMNKTPGAKINRANIGAELVEKGYCESIEQAFNTVLSQEFGLYQPPKRLNALEIITFIKSIGGVSVLAHPYLAFNDGELKEFIALAKPKGLTAIETNYSTFTQAQTERLIRIANEFGIKRSGGSDYHGKNKPDIQLGIGKGNLRVEYSILENLKKD